ncbi:MAG TPA: TIGR01777 family oxidoreductase [Thermodesulfobacteriota bacterium]|nr:TIGR01777 family oxidoreductase [Thermodesulfobacteriota bacterium]
MKILITGSTGLIGSSLVSFLSTGGHSVTRLTHSKSARSKLGETVAHWNPKEKDVDISGLEGHDAVVHLAGENINGRWTGKKKKEIRNSRVNGTRFLAESLAKLNQPPKVLVCASAIGYYGNRGNEILTEESPPGKGFLAEVCKEWEKAAEPAVKKGIRVVHVRFGVVLSPKGGALGMMLLPFRAGFGGRIGSGDQYWSWIAIDDVIGAIYHAITNETVAGPVNTVSPLPVTNREFTETLGRVLNRPTLLPVPAFATRLALGSEMADEMLLASVRAEPMRLLNTGYNFQYPGLEGALRHLLGK